MQESLSYLSAEQADQLNQYLADLQIIQDVYREFVDFYYDVSTELLGFVPSEMQMDIAWSLQHSPQYYMIQSQRGEAKTTITGAYAVWCLIHNVKHRILIVSADSGFASDIMLWCTQIIEMMPILAPLAANPTGQCRRNSEKYDINMLLKGAGKDPSIRCLGVFAGLPGKRADLLIADDIESNKNSRTEAMRQILLETTKEFSKINSNGRIVFLGTPQSMDSVYNSLPSRGYTIEIWPGRIPTDEECQNYGVFLSPFVKSLYDKHPDKRTGYGLDGTRGYPTDTVMMNEEQLCRKELDGKANFNLHYMLDTTLTDKDKYPLKPENLIFYSLDPAKAPIDFVWSNAQQLCMPAVSGQVPKHKYYWPAWASPDHMEYQQRLVAFDPAGGGQNGDETGYAVVFALAGRLFLMEIGGIPGGAEDSRLSAAVAIMRKWKVHSAICEKNFGHGMYTMALQKKVLEENAAAKENGKPEDIVNAGVMEVYNTGQKERRIIDSLEPIISGHLLVVNTSCISEDISAVQKYGAADRTCYMFMHQLAKISLEKGSLIHEDRLDALSIAARELMQHIKVVAKEEQQKLEEEKLATQRNDPNSIWAYAYGGIMNRPTAKNAGVLDRINNRRRM